MKVGAAAALAALSLASPAWALPDITFEQFEALCVKTGALAPQVLARADSDGWSELPNSQVDLSRERLSQYRMRTRSDGASKQLLIVADADAGSEIAPPGMKDFHGHICMVTAKMDLDATKAALKTRMGFQPTMSTSDAVMYAFSETGAGRKPMSAEDDAAGMAAAKDGSLRVLMLKSDRGFTALLYLVSVPTVSDPVR
jgi:hypothetical protein